MPQESKSQKVEKHSVSMISDDRRRGLIHTVYIDSIHPRVYGGFILPKAPGAPTRELCQPGKSRACPRHGSCGGVSRHSLPLVEDFSTATPRTFWARPFFVVRDGPVFSRQSSSTLSPPHSMPVDPLSCHTQKNVSRRYQVNG